jgi:toxin ParE1/3/4
MRCEVIFSKEAEDDLIDIYKFVAINDSFEKAEALFENLMNTCLSLKDFPNRGHIVLEFYDLVNEYLEIIYKPYRIIYKINKNQVRVMGILDGRRNLKEILHNRLLK